MKTRNKIRYYIIAILAAIVLMVISTSMIRAQQDPQYSQYMFNMMSVNPAYTGTRDAMNILLLSRLQWVGLDGAPRSHTLALHTPIREKKIGLGASVISDNIGPVKSTYINLNYAYRLKLTETLTLSAGLKAGINNYDVNLTGLELNESDPSFGQDYTRNFQPNFGVGFYLYSNQYYAGFSIPKLLKESSWNSGSPDQGFVSVKRHFFLTAGYVFELNSDWKFKPSLLNKIVEGAPPSLDVTAQVLYRDRFWLGTTYRIGDAIAILFEMQVNKQITVGYAYDITVSQMRKTSNGSHEILVSYDFTGYTNDRVKSPRYF